jgi:THO complex subunit 4
LTLTTDSPR